MIASKNVEIKNMNQKYKYSMKEIEVAYCIKNTVKSISVVKETVLKNKEKESN